MITTGSSAPLSERAAPGPLPFDLPEAAVLRASAHHVFAHYFPPYPISLDNEDPRDDYYTREYLAPSGEQGRHASYGGLLRERPLMRPASGSPDWQLDDLKVEVRRAISAGLDGFTVDLLGLPGSAYWSTVELLLRAAQEVDAAFRIVLMPDATSPDVRNAEALAAAVAELARRFTSVYRLDDGRLVVSPFAPEQLGADWWAGWLTLMRDRYGLAVALVPCFVDEDERTWAPFVALSYGLSDWGDRSPAFNTYLASPMATAHGTGRIWMQPVSLQDQRPAQHVYDEAHNTENLRLTWEAAIAGADWVQLTTWNDYAEGSELAPSTHIGWAPLDITSYYLTRFKTGSWPPIVRDVVYLSHRVHAAGATPTGQRVPMRLRPGSSPARDDVEVLTFLTAPATVELVVGGRSHTFAVPAGMHAVRAPLASGEVSLSVLRGNQPVISVRSPFEVVRAPVTQDEGYHMISSGREGFRSLG